MRTVAIAAVLVGALMGCSGAAESRATQTGAEAAPAPVDRGADTGVAIDASLQEALAEFRRGLVATDTLRHAAPSRDSLVRAFVGLLARRDTIGLARLHVSRSEWAWLVYPESRYVRAPYAQRIDIGWMLIIERSNSAVARLLDRRGGQPLELVRWQCADSPEPEGRNLYWGRCTVTYRDARGATHTERLFSSILERDGRFKIGSYANQF